MLPLSYFERLARVSNLRTVLRSSDRREKPRLPVYVKGRLLTLSASGAVQEEMTVRVRDLSESGISVIVPNEVGLSLTVVIGLTPAGGETHWMDCRLRRIAHLDGITRLAAASFERVLLPGQRLGVGTGTRNLSWLNVMGAVSPEDPFAESGTGRQLEFERV